MWFFEAKDSTVADVLILINSAQEEKKGSIRLDRAYTICEDVYGNALCSLADGTLNFSIHSDESAVITLTK